MIRILWAYYYNEPNPPRAGNLRSFPDKSGLFRPNPAKNGQERGDVHEYPQQLHEPRAVLGAAPPAHGYRRRTPPVADGAALCGSHRAGRNSIRHDGTHHPFSGQTPEGLHIPRTPATLICLVLFLAVLGTALFYLISGLIGQIVALANSFPTLWPDLLAQVRDSVQRLFAGMGMQPDRFWAAFDYLSSQLGVLLEGWYPQLAGRC